MSYTKINTKLMQKHSFPRGLLKYFMGPGKHELTAP